MRCRLPIVASVGTRKIACRKPRTRTTSVAAAQSAVTTFHPLDRVGAELCMGSILYLRREHSGYPPKGLFRVQNRAEKQQARRRKDDIVGPQQPDPEIYLDRVQLAGQNAGRRVH